MLKMMFFLNQLYPYTLIITLRLFMSTHLSTSINTLAMETQVIWLSVQGTDKDITSLL